MYNQNGSLRGFIKLDTKEAIKDLRSQADNSSIQFEFPATLRDLPPWMSDLLDKLLPTLCNSSVLLLGEGSSKTSYRYGRDSGSVLGHPRTCTHAHITRKSKEAMFARLTRPIWSCATVKSFLVMTQNGWTRRNTTVQNYTQRKK